MRSPLLPALLLLVPLAAPLACSDTVTVSAEANARCEEATDALKVEGDEMLPGRRCLACHVKSGLAEDEALTAGGTVFEKAQQTCNAGGAHGVVVELLTRDGTVQAKTTSGASGNFHFKQPLTFPLRARVTLGGVVREMTDPVDTGDCASCHDGTTVPRINLQ